MTGLVPKLLENSRGYVIVPMKPTRKMIKAAAFALSKGHRPNRYLSVKEKHIYRYRAMVEAFIMENINRD